MIYTKTGDRGTTSMFETDPKKRNRLSKANLRVEAIGAVDELNSYLGIANYYCKTKPTYKVVKEIQKNLFTIGAVLSNAPLKLPKGATLDLEKEIDALEEALPPLRNFILPDGSESAVHFMYARSLARKAERSIVTLYKRQKVASEILEYINRLSDYLFCVFRHENNEGNKKEEIWMGDKTSA